MQLFTMLEAEEGYCILADELYMAITAWLAMRDPAAATQKWDTHHAIPAQWTRSQQQNVFQQALQLAKELPDAAAWQMAEQACLLGAVKNKESRAPSSSEQTHALVQALLSDHQHEAAFQVSKPYIISTALNTVSISVCVPTS